VAPATLFAGDVQNDEGGQIQLLWTASTSAGTVGYTVYRSTTSGSGYVQVGPMPVVGTEYVDATPSDRVTYYYIVRSWDGTLESVASSPESAAESVDNIPPAAPQGFVADDVPNDDGGAIGLSWTPSTSTDVVEQRVYRSLTSGTGFTLRQTIADNVTGGYTDTAVTDGTTYFYKVAAYDGESETFSGESSATPLDNLAPAAPTMGTVINVVGSVTATLRITWTPSTSADVVEQRLFRTTSSGGPYVQAAAFADNTTAVYTDAGLVNGVTYYYVLQAFDGTNNSPFSAEGSGVPIDTVPPDPATAVAAADTPDDDGTQLDLTWVNSVSSDVVSHRIYRGTDGSTFPTLVVELSDFSTAYTDTGLTAGQTYYYVVRAFDGTNESSDSNTASAKTLDNRPPAVPTGLAAADVPADSGGQLQVTWNANTDFDLAGYRLYRSRAGSAFQLVHTAGVGETSYIDQCLTNLATYTYQLSAFDVDAIESDPSAPVSAVPINNTGVRDLTVNHTVAGEGAGQALTDGGDLNGDGVPDLVITADLASPGGRAAAGEVFIRFGGGCLNGTQTLGSSDVAILGAAAGDDTGLWVASGGDFNGDDINDLVISAHQADTGTGKVYVLFGRSVWPAQIDLATSADLVITGRSATDNFGIALDMGGDVNGDGFDDLLVGAYRESVGTSLRAGRVYLFLGRATPPSSLSVNNADLVLDGAQTNGQAGTAVSNSGDVDGDGIDDILVAALGVSPGGYANAGSVYLVRGRTDIAAAANMNLFSANTRFDGTAAGELAGSAVSLGGDFNGDGIGDIAIGAKGAAPGALANAGAAYVIYGSVAGLPANVKLSNADFTVQGAEAGALLGTALDLHSDVNEDGLADLLVGAPRSSPGGLAQAGAVYVLYGKTGAPAVMAVSDDDRVMTGDAAGDQLGISVATGGDANGDGVADLAVGANRADPSGVTDAGAAYLITGAAGWDQLAPTTPAAVTANALGGSAVQLSWDPSFDNVKVDRYRVERSDDGVNFTLLGETTATGYTDTAVVDGAVYYYRVSALDGLDHISPASAVVSAVLDSVPPTAPTNLTGAPDSPAQITLTWSGASDNVAIAGYAVLRNNVLVATPTGTTYTDTGLTPGTTYTYAVQTLDFGGNASAPITTQVTTPQDLTPPSVPGGLAAVAVSDSTVHVTWTASTDDTGVAGYKVYRDSLVTATGSTADTFFDDGPLNPSVAHNYRVTAFDGAGNESLVGDSEVVVVRTLPSAPTALAVVDAPADSGGNLNLTWTPWASVSVTEQRIYRSLTAGGPYSLVAGVGNTVAAYTDTGLTNGTTYYYVIRSFDGVNESLDSAEAGAFPFNNASPNPPTSLFAADTPADNGGSIGLTWSVSTSGTVVAQRVYRATAPGAYGATPIATFADNTTTTYTDADAALVNGTTYYYVVRSFNGTAESLNSNEAAAAPVDNLAPTAPTGLSAADTPGDNGRSITLNWSPSVSAGVAAQRIYRSTTAGGPYGLVASIGNNTTTTYADTSVSNGTTYYYVVRASDGGNESADSNQVSAVSVDNLTPAAPTGLSAADTVGDNGGSITLSWTPSSAPDVIEQRVLRATTSGGPYSQVGTIVGNGTSTYADTTAVDGTTYYYVIRAYDGSNVSGNSGQASAVSVNDAPPAAPAALVAADLPNDDGGRLTLTWTVSPSGDVTRQMIYRGTSSGSHPTLVATLFDNTTNSYVDSGLVDNTTYYYVVRVSDGVQTSPDSPEASAAPLDNGAPAPPTGFAVADTPGDDGHSLALTWTPSVSAGVTEQRIYRGTSPGSHPTLVASLPGNTDAAYTDASGLANGTVYYYVVRAWNGTQLSVDLNEASAAPVDNLVPAAPSGLTAADTAPDSGGSITLGWTPSASLDVVEQRVYRGTSPGGPYGLVGNLAGNTEVGFTDTTTVDGTTYYYVIRAFDGTSESGNSGQASAVSVDNLASAVGQAGIAYAFQADADPAQVQRGGTFLVRFAVRDQQGLPVSGLAAADFSGLVLTNLASGLALTPAIDYTTQWLGERVEADGLYDMRVTLSASAAIAAGSAMQVDATLSDPTATDGRLMESAAVVYVETAPPAGSFRWGAVEPAAVNIAADQTTLAATVKFYDATLTPTDDGDKPWTLARWVDSAGVSQTPTLTVGYNGATQQYDVLFTGITAMTPGRRQYVTLEYQATPQQMRRLSFSLITDAAGATGVGLANPYLVAPRLYVAPTASIVGPGSVDEGGVLNLSGGVGAHSDGISAYAWDMDYDGTTFQADYTSQVVAHGYGAGSAGVYTVAFQVTDNLGLTSLATQDIVVTQSLGGNALPQARVEVPAQTVVGQPATFNGTALDADGTIIQYEWDFDYAGTPSLFFPETGLTAPTAQWTFASAGPHLVALRVTDDQGGQAVATATATVEYGPPTAVATALPTTVTSGTFVNFDGTASTAGDGTASGLTYEWDFGYDGTFNPQVSASVVANSFITVGVHTVALRVTDGYGKTDVATVDVVVSGGATQGLRKMHVFNLDTDAEEVIVGTPFHVYYNVRDQEGLALSGLTQADFPTGALVLTNRTTATQLGPSTDYTVGSLVEEAPGVYRQELTLVPGAPLLPGDRVLVEMQLVGTTPLADAFGATDGRVTRGVTEFRVAGGGGAPPGVFAHVVVQPAAPTIGPAATSYSLKVRFYDQAGTAYAPSSASNLVVAAAVNQSGVAYTPWTAPANRTVTYNAANQEYDVSLANLSGQVLGDRVYVTLQHVLEDGATAAFSFAVEVANVPPQQVGNPQYGDPDFR